MRPEAHLNELHLLAARRHFVGVVSEGNEVTVVGKGDDALRVRLGYRKQVLEDCCEALALPSKWHREEGKRQTVKVKYT